MSKIRILPEFLSNKIAAGEVVERPCSVVKELVENALDANSSNITIEVEKGGRSLIRISDNGVGMNRDDALLALERYATSKIYKDDDLFSISTLGFRGEALPSIASVSLLSVVTKDKESSYGSEIIVEGGAIKKVSEIGAPVGTVITVKRLFFNTPVRQKFLKTINTEMGHIADAIASIAIGKTNVCFKLCHNGKTVKHFFHVSDPVDRIADVLGNDIQNDLHKIKFNDDCIALKGWISSPSIVRNTSRGIYVYVNGRFVRDRIVQHALFDGYSERLMKGRFPVAVIFIEVPFDQVDVNVHPTKQEIKFLNQKKIHEAIKKSVLETLSKAAKPKWTNIKPSNEEKTYVAESTEYHYTSKKTPNSESYKTDNNEIGNERIKCVDQTNLWKEKIFSGLKIIGQFHNSYLLCESDESLIMIDQHAAHERIVFECLKNQYENSKKNVQKLLIPETIDLGYKEANALLKLVSVISQIGIEIESFGGNTFVIKSVPVLLSNKEVKPLIIEITEKAAEIGVASKLSKIIDECLILMACHGAIRANQQLSIQQVRTLLEQLDECANPSTCPHGRPIWTKWTIKSLEKSFGRIK